MIVKRFVVLVPPLRVVVVSLIFVAFDPPFEPVVVVVVVLVVEPVVFDVVFDVVFVVEPVVLDVVEMFELDFIEKPESFQPAELRCQISPVVRSR